MLINMIYSQKVTACAIVFLKYNLNLFSKFIIFIRQEAVSVDNVWVFLSLFVPRKTIFNFHHFQRFENLQVSSREFLQTSTGRVASLSESDLIVLSSEFSFQELDISIVYYFPILCASVSYVNETLFNYIIMQFSLLLFSSLQFIMWTFFYDMLKYNFAWNKVEFNSTFYEYG